MIHLALPWPPSVNTYWRSVTLPTKRGSRSCVLLSERGRAYRKAVWEQTLQDGLTAFPISGRLKVTVYAYPPDRRVRDLDNLLKGLLDALAYAQVIEDDGMIDDLHILRRQMVAPRGLVSVRIEEAGIAAESFIDTVFHTGGPYVLAAS